MHRLCAQRRENLEPCAPVRGPSQPESIDFYLPFGAQVIEERLGVTDEEIRLTGARESEALAFSRLQRAARGAIRRHR